MMTKLFVICLIHLLLHFQEKNWVFSFRARNVQSCYQRKVTVFSNVASVPPLTTTPPQKILVVVEPSPFTYISGYANRFKEMLTHLKAASDEVVIITTDKNLEEAPKSFLNFPIRALRGFELPVYKQVTCTFDIKSKIKEEILRFRPDVIHVSAPSACVFPATFWARKYNIPLVVSYHTDFVRYSQTYLKFPGSKSVAELIMRLVLNQADLVLATSPQLELELNGLSILRTDVWMKGVNTNIFTPQLRSDEMRAFLTEGNPHLPLLLYVGRLGHEKRIDRLKRVVDSIPGVRLAIVGEGPAESSLRKLFANSSVFFAGSLRGKALSEAFASADIFVMPSNTETLGFVVLEALASGKPAVAVAAGGLVDIIEDGETGYLAEDKDDMFEFTAKVKDLIENPDMRHRMADNARRWALNWNWERATSKLRNVQYQRAIAIHAARHNHNRKHVDSIVQSIFEHHYLRRNGMKDDRASLHNKENEVLNHSLPIQLFDDDNF